VAKTHLIKLLGFATLPILLGHNDCVPPLPAEDPFLTHHSQRAGQHAGAFSNTVRSLEQQYCEPLLMLQLDSAAASSKPIKCSQAARNASGNAVIFYPSSRIYWEAQTIAQSIEGFRELKRVEWGFDNAHTEEAKKDWTVTFYLRKKALRRGPSVSPITFYAACDMDEAGTGTCTTKPKDLEMKTDQRAVNQIVSGMYDRLLDQVQGYEKAHLAASQKIMTKLMNCPQGTLPHPEHVHEDADKETYFCQTKEGKKHGPYIEGVFSLDLKGVRQVQGRYQNGRKHGQWVWRSPSGKQIRTEKYVNGTRQPTKAEQQAKQKADAQKAATKTFYEKKQACAEELTKAIEWNRGLVTESEFQAELEQLQTGDAADVIATAIAAQFASTMNNFFNSLEEVAFTFGAFEQKITDAKAPCEAALRAWSTKIPRAEKKQVEQWMHSIEKWGERKKASTAARMAEKDREARACQQRCYRPRVKWLCKEGWSRGQLFHSPVVGDYEATWRRCTCRAEILAEGCTLAEPY